MSQEEYTKGDLLQIINRLDGLDEKLDTMLDKLEDIIDNMS